MHSMETNRRKALILIASAVSGGFLLTQARPRTAYDQTPVFAGACGSREGDYRMTCFSLDGSRMAQCALPGRGHSVEMRPFSNEAIVFARRPGTFAIVFDTKSGQKIQTLESVQGRHFYGHGVFDFEGHYVYATENDYGNGRGVIGIYEAGDAYRRVGEIPSHGIGPHEIRIHPDGDILIVTNGGIQTHPDIPRVKMNLPTMDSSLCYIDRQDGKLLSKVTLPERYRKLSIRHIDINRIGTVGVAMQYEGPSMDTVPLIGTSSGGTEVKLIDEPIAIIRSMQNYCGSIAFDSSGKVLAVSAPKGNRITFWNVSTGEFLASANVADACGISPGLEDGEFLISGRNALVLAQASNGRINPLILAGHEKTQWDNHLCKKSAQGTHS